MSKTPPLQPGWVAPERTALLLIDCQVDFGAPDGAMARRGADIAPAQAALARVETLTAAARDAGVTVMFVRLIGNAAILTPVAREAKQRRGDGEPELCREGTHGADFIGPQPRANEKVISKSRFSAFSGTGLDHLLQERGLDTVVLAGLTTECCIQSSAWDAFERDFHVFIAADACAAYQQDLHDHAIKALEMSGAMVANGASFAALWKKSS